MFNSIGAKYEIFAHSEYLRMMTDINIFTKIRGIYGWRCLTNKEHAKKARNLIYKHISDNCSYKAVVKKIIKQALEFHAATPCSSHDVYDDPTEALYIAAHLCQKYSIEDSKLVLEVVQTAISCTGNHDRWFEFLDPLAFSCELENNLYPIYNQSNAATTVVTKEQLNALEYFLTHCSGIVVRTNHGAIANILGLNETAVASRWSDVAFIDAPLSSCRNCNPLLLACQAESPEGVRLLLRYGAQPMFPVYSFSDPSGQQRFPLQVLAMKLNASVFWKTHIHAIESNYREEFMRQRKAYDMQINECINAFQTALPTLPLRPCQQLTQDHMGSSSTLFCVHPSYKSSLPRSITHGPRTLRHIAKCTVRNTLSRNNGNAIISIPKKIQQLPLPILIKEYIDLQIDL
ncbi:unnamed protein product [Owenia fusiformis]|uniref:SOCS box domain-containing protein n=1 Tax=Owenia fusiformis TaxID=6347 RepID=A0A8S4PNZ2_OWEFU|nr:unnamed protein product [Owenia fusiformis]